MTAREELDKIKLEWNLKTDEELAKKLETSKNNIDSWIKRDKIPEKWVLKIVQNVPNKLDNIVKIPKLSSKVSAGYNIQAIDSIEKIGELILDISLFKTPPPKKLFTMQVDGYSMIPMIFPDSWVIFDDCKQFKGDGLYIINWDDCLMVKQISATPKKGVIQIISANKDYQSWEVDLNDSQCSFMIFGKVIRTIL
jgi:phage repressor protein C with HTH and peptisase S24 domain